LEKIIRKNLANVEAPLIPEEKRDPVVRDFPAEEEGIPAKSAIEHMFLCRHYGGGPHGQAQADGIRRSGGRPASQGERHG
jgi:hypothetical protein